MSVFELGECSRLAARISPEQCHKNRKGGVFACSGCIGLNNTRLVAYKPIEHDPAPLEPEVLPKIIIVDETINEEDLDMSSKPTPRGNCPTCGRDDVLLPGPKCHRCYGRIKKGLDPVTGEPAAPVKPAKVTKPTPPPVPEKQAPVARQAAPASGEIGSSLTIDIISHLDAAWASRRAEWIKELTEADSLSNRLRYAADMIKAVEQLGY